MNPVRAWQSTARRGAESAARRRLFGSGWVSRLQRDLSIYGSFEMHRRARAILRPIGRTLTPVRKGPERGMSRPSLSCGRVCLLTVAMQHQRQV
jgi:hypothetical protein